MAQFTPPRCPNRACPRHRNPTPGFCYRRGTFRVLCRPHPIQRYRCKSCRRSFSDQTFRADYRDRRPETNVPLFVLLTSGVGFRQSGRELRLSIGAVQWKFRKLGRLAHRLNRNLLRELPAGHTFLFDEFETFERSSICPLTVPVLIEKASMAVIAFGVAPIRRVQKRGSHRQRWLERTEQERGRRKDLSRRCIRRTLEHLEELLAGGEATMVTDCKSAYETALRRLFGDQITHIRHPGSMPRTTFNPLFRINLTEAMLRDNLGRMRRRSWLHTKNRRRLRLHLELYASYRNLVRKRTNHDSPDTTPATVLGLITRPLSRVEVLAWRQDWGELSIHPSSLDGKETVGVAGKAVA